VSTQNVLIWYKNNESKAIQPILVYL